MALKDMRRELASKCVIAVISNEVRRKLPLDNWEVLRHVWSKLWAFLVCVESVF